MSLAESGMGRLHPRRNEANNVVSTCIALAEQSPNPIAIWNQVEQNLVRLSAGPNPIRDLSPQELIKITRASQTSSLSEIVANYGKQRKDIYYYQSTVGTTLAFILQRKGLISEPPPTVDQRKYDQLKALNDEADTVASLITRPEVSKQLEHMPDLKALLDCFCQYSTVKPFLDDKQVPHKPEEVRHYNRYLREFLFSDKAPRLTGFLRTATFSNWLKKKTNWFNTSENQITENINRCANFVCSEHPPANKVERVYAYYMKWFLKQFLARELAGVQQDIYFGHQIDINTMFVPANVREIKKLDDIDPGQSYKLFAHYYYLPQSINSFARDYIERFNKAQLCSTLASEMYKDLAYNPKYKEQWLTGGLMFLENALLMKPDEMPNWTKLTMERKKELRKFRRVFQTALHETQ